MAFLIANFRWVAGGFLLSLFSSFGQTFFISLWSSEIRAAYGLTHGSFGGIYMLATLGSAAVLPFLGRLIDWTTIRTFALGVMAMLTLAALGMAFSTSVYAVGLSIFLLRLFGQGLMTHSSMTAMGRWFAASRGRAVSIAAVGHQAGEAIFPLIFIGLAAWMTWQQTWLVAAALIAFVAVPIISLCVRQERVPEGEEAERMVSGRQWTRGEVMRDPLFWTLAVGVMLPPLTGTSIFFHQDYLIELNGWEPSIYYGGFALMALTTIVVALAAGLAVDRFGAPALLPFFLVPLGCACLMLGLFAQEWAAIGFLFLLGVSYGISSTLFGALWPEIYGTAHLGAIRSLVVAMMVFVTAAGPGVTGALIDFGVPFPQQALAIGLYCFAAAFLMWRVALKLQVRQAVDISRVELAGTGA